MSHHLFLPYQLSVDDLVLLGSSGVASLIALYGAVRLRRARARARAVGYEDVIGRRIEGFVADYLDSLGRVWFRVNLSEVIAPEGFEGEWGCLKLGSGGWGTAYLLRRENTLVVAKVPHGFESIIESGEAPTVNEKLLKSVREEAELLSRLDHPHVIKLVTCSRKAPLLIYEFADQGTLEWQLCMGWKPDLKNVLLIGTQLADAIRYIHTRGLVHGDIKAGNIFVVNGIVKLGDFSSITKLLSITSSKSRWSYTPGWRAPEQVYSDLRSKASRRGLEDRIDVYQLGNLILYLLTNKVIDGEEAIREEAIEEALKNVRHNRVKELLKRLLSPKAEERPSAAEAVKELYKLYTTTGPT